LGTDDAERRARRVWPAIAQCSRNPGSQRAKAGGAGPACEQDRLELAPDAAQLGWWEYDPVRRVLSWDGHAREICDYAENELTIEEFLKRKHPDDMARFLAVREAALDPVDPKPYGNVYRIVRSDGKVRWVESRVLILMATDPSAGS
jgi:PAS domain S-box-containing protein